jgi:hypothetical protein
MNTAQFLYISTDIEIITERKRQPADGTEEYK